MSTKVRSRLVRRFELWDTDRNGHVDRSDFELESHRILTAFGEADTTPRGQAVVDAYLAMWDYLSGMAKVGPEGSLGVSRFETVAQLEIILMDLEGFGAVLRTTVQATLSLCDADGDGQINLAEFRSWMKALGVGQADADEAFEHIDTDGNGQLSIDELVQAVREYHAGAIDIPLLGR